MTLEEKLPCELTEEILSRVPPKSLVRFRTVSKQWNALFNDKSFINNHKSTFRFILATQSNIYSVSISPKIVVRELTLDIPGLDQSQTPNYEIVDCDEFLLCSMDKGAAVWNPWLNRSRWFKDEVSQPTIILEGIGFDSNRRAEENVYKTIWYRPKTLLEHTKWKIHTFASDAWKDVVSESGGRDERRKRPTFSTSSVSLNGTLYWVVHVEGTDPASYFLNKFDFSKEGFFRFCDLPCGMNHPRNALVLRVFKGDRFSLLAQCYVTKKIEVWVTKNKINHDDGDDVVWMSLMNFPVLDLPSLVDTDSYSQPSYYIDGKRLVVCSCDETGRAWIYVMGDNKLISKTRIDSVVDKWPLHCTYFPNLVPIPRGQREKRKREESE